MGSYERSYIRLDFSKKKKTKTTVAPIISAKWKRRSNIILTTLGLLSSFLLLAPSLLPMLLPSPLDTIMIMIMPASAAVLDIDLIDSVGGTGWDPDIDRFYNSSSNCLTRYISYWHGSNGDLRVAFSGTLPNQWKTQTVDSVGDVGRDTSIAIGPDCSVHISYHDETNENLKYAKKPFGSNLWQLSIVDDFAPSTAPYRSSITVDSNGVPHISYHDSFNGDLKYAKKIRGGAWSVQTIDSNGNVGGGCSIAVDSNGVPHISYWDNTNNDLKYAKKLPSGAWSVQTIDSNGNVGYHTSIAIDSNGVPHISYHDATNLDLKYAKKVGAWSTETADSIGHVGWQSAITVDSNGVPHISYYDWFKEELKYVKKVQGIWVKQIVDSQGDVGLSSSIEIEPSGKHIAYFDLGNQDLKWALVE